MINVQDFTVFHLFRSVEATESRVCLDYQDIITNGTSLGMSTLRVKICYKDREPHPSKELH